MAAQMPPNRPSTRFMGPMAYCHPTFPAPVIHACSRQLKPMMQVVSSNTLAVISRLGALGWKPCSLTAVQPAATMAGPTALTMKLMTQASRYGMSNR